MLSLIKQPVIRTNEHTPSSLIPSSGLTTKPNGFSKNDYSAVPFTPLLNDAIQRPHTMMVMGCKMESNSHNVLRRPSLPSASSMYPHTGYGRHQLKGLNYQDEKPMDLPLMPKASPFYAGANNRLGEPLG